MSRRLNSVLGFIFFVLLAAAAPARDALYVLDSHTVYGDYGGPRVLVMDPASGQRSVVSGPIMYGPQFVTYDPVSGLLYATDLGDSFSLEGDEGVWAFSPNTTEARLVSGMGIGRGPLLDEPYGIAAGPDGKIYVADYGLDAVIQIDPISGDRTILSDRDHGTGSRTFSYLYGITIDHNGTMYATDQAGYIFRVNRTNGNRTVVSGYGVGSGPDLSYPFGIKADANGKLIVVDYGQDMLLRIDPTTGNRTIITDNSASYSGPKFFEPRDVQLLGDGSFLVTDLDQHLVIRVQPNGQRVAFSGNPSSPGAGTYGAGPEIDKPRGITMAANGALFIADQTLMSLIRIEAASGNRSYLMSSYRGHGPFIMKPQAITRENQDGLLVMDGTGSGCQVLRINIHNGDRQVVSSETVGAGPNLYSAEGLAVGPDGDILVANYGEANVLRINPLTGNRSILSEGYPSDIGTGEDFSSPLGIGCSRDGILIVTDSWNKEVYRVGLYTGDRAPYDLATLALADPTAPCFDPQGRIYFSDYSRDAVFRIDPATGQGTVISGYPPAINRGSGPAFGQPSAMIFDQSGQLYVGDGNVGAVMRVDPVTGNRTVVSGSDPVNGLMVGAGPLMLSIEDIVNGPEASFPDNPGGFTDEFLDLGGKPIYGACADGVTELYLEISRLPAGTVAGDLSLAALGTGEGSILGSWSMDSAQHTARLRYRVPARFTWGAVATHAVNFTVTVKGEKRTRQLLLARPPVVMLHGLWSSGAVWSEMEHALKAAGCRFTLAYDYQWAHGLSFYDNSLVAKVAITTALRQARAQGYLACQADVIAHSMGGVLTRYYLEDLARIKYQGDIHKFITIGTPHSGSGMANMLLGCRPIPILVNAVNGIIWALGGSIWDGAVDDLAVDSIAIDQMLNNSARTGLHPVPVHAIVGTADAMLDAKDARPWNWGEALFKLMLFGYGQTAVSHWLSFPNDYIVAATSQHGGASARTEIAVAAHPGESSNAGVIAKAVQLIDQSVTGGSFDLTGFDHPTNITGKPAAGKTLPQLKVSSAVGTVAIGSPAEGSSFAPGSKLTVTVSATGAVRSVYIGTPFAAAIDDTAPFTASFDVPTEYDGELPINVLGSDGAGVVAGASRTVVVIPAAAIVSLDTPYGDLLPASQGQQYSLRVLGTFDDGVVRDVTSPALGTTYRSANPAVAAVTPEGLLKALSPGQTALTITNTIGNSVSRVLRVDVILDSLSNGAADWAMYD